MIYARLETKQNWVKIIPFDHWHTDGSPCYFIFQKLEETLLEFKFIDQPSVFDFLTRVRREEIILPYKLIVNYMEI